MERKKKCKTLCFSTILWAIAPVLLCALPCEAQVVVNEGETLNVSDTINDSVNVYSGGTLNLLDGGAISSDLYALDYSVVNITGGAVTGLIVVETYADVTVYGTSFELNGDDLDPSVTYFTLPMFTTNLLEGTYGGDAGSIYLCFITYTPDVQINLAGPSTTIEVQIDIKPGSYPNSINLGSNGVVPVAILSTTDFDATLISADTVFLAGSGVAIRGKGNNYLSSKEDVNGDGILDLVVKVETENLDKGTFQDGYAILEVREFPEDPDSVIYWGWDEITIVPPE